MRRNICYLSAGIIIAFSLAAIIGWHTNTPALFQLQEGFAPMQYNTALCFLGCGISLVAAANNLRWITLLFSLLVGILAVPTIIQHLFQIDILGIDRVFIEPNVTTLTPSPGRMSFLTAVSFLFSITALSGSALKTKRWRTSGFTGIIAALVIAISALGFIGYAAGLTKTDSWEYIAQMSLPTVSGFMAMGLGLLSIAWRDCVLNEKRQPTWLPIAILIMSLTISILIGSAIYSHESYGIKRHLADQSTLITSILTDKIEERQEAIRRMARRWATATTPDKAAWQRDAHQYVKDYGNYHFVGWANSALELEWTIPATEIDLVGDRNILPEGMGLEQLIQVIKENDEVITTQLGIYNNDLCVIAPISHSRDFEGYILAPIETSEFIEGILPPELTRGCHFTLTAGNQQLFRRGESPKPSDQQWSTKKSFLLQSTRWTLTIWPDPEFVDSEHSLYAKVVFVLGILVSILLGATSYLIQLASAKSAESAERNLQLQAEISERIRARKKLEQASALNNAIVMHSPYSVITTDVEGLITSVNPAAERMLGYKAQELVGKHSPATFHDLGEIAAQAKALSKRFDETIEPGFGAFVAEVNKGLSSQYEWTYIRKDGSRLPVTLGVSALTGNKGEIMGYLGIANDISDLKNTMKELKETHEKLIVASLQVGRAEVATNILHNVGNVLNSINITSSLLSEKVRHSRITSISKTADMLDAQSANLSQFFETDRRGKELPRFLHKLSEKLKSEQQDMISDLSELDQNIQHIREIVAMQQSHSKVTDFRERVAVHELIDMATRMHIAALNKNHVDIKTDCDPSIMIHMEKHKVLQIIINLISNAKHACIATGTHSPLIEVNVTADEQNCQIVVADNGEGICEKNMTLIFNHGFTTKTDGHGFGLHSCAIAAKQMNGSLTAASPGPDMGATFTLTLPIS